MHQLVKNLLLSFISIFLFILLGEILTRIFWLPDNKNETIRKGIILEGANRTVVYEGIEYKVNSYGIRNKEVPIEKGNDDLRIMALGDSFIWGDGLQNDELITYKLESLLTKKFNQQVSVINTGISGFNTKDEFNQLTRLYSAYKPDAVFNFSLQMIYSLLMIQIK
ncbi:MAG: hypothetical protein K8F60_13975 [Melioribacteraceae bacterium]|nr:hypothetical protein [Melioribacteraceae bacterium]